MLRVETCCYRAVRVGGMANNNVGARLIRIGTALFFLKNGSLLLLYF